MLKKYQNSQTPPTVQNSEQTPSLPQHVFPVVCNRQATIKTSQQHNNLIAQPATLGIFALFYEHKIQKN